MRPLKQKITMALNVEYKQLLDAGVHFGHLTRKWDPRMAPYIFMERNGIHIIDLNKTLSCLEEAVEVIKDIVRSNKRIMFVATKKQAKDLVAAEAKRLKMPYVTDRWLGGMLTNFQTVRKSLKKLQSIDKMTKDVATYNTLTKKEKLMMSRDREKLDRVLGGITEMKALPSALFIIDVKKEHIAVAEAQKLGIPVIGMVDTNSNPYDCDYPIPANDDAFKSIALITRIVSEAIEEALKERRRDKEDADSVEDEMNISTATAEGEGYEAAPEVIELSSPVTAAVATELEVEADTDVAVAEPAVAEGAGVAIDPQVAPTGETKAPRTRMKKTATE